MTADLRSVLSLAQDIGLIGPGPLAPAIEQAERFAAAIPAAAERLADIGSGGGLPGLVIASRRPDLAICLVDRRERAGDMLRRAVAALGWDDRVSVVVADVAELGRRSGWRSSFDVVTARGVGRPGDVAELALPLVRTGGLLVVSAAGVGEAWPDEGLAQFDATALSRADGLVVILAGCCPDRFPRARRSPAIF